MRVFSRVSLSVSILLLAACGPDPSLIIRPDPANALVDVMDQNGKDLVANSSGATKFQVHYDSNSKYTVRVSGGGSDAARYEQWSRDLAESDFKQLPTDLKDNNTHLLDVKLVEKVYTDIPGYELNLDPRYGWVNTPVQQRSFHDVVEQGGGVPTRVVDFSGDQAITGMCLSPDGSRIVYSVTTYNVDNMELLRRQRLDQIQDLPLKASNLYAVGTSGGGVQHITDENFQDLYPAFTTDGKFLLFGSNRRRTDSTDILRTSAEGRGGIANIYVDQRNSRAVKATQAADSTIAFCMYPEGWSKPADAQIWTTDGPNQFPTQIASGTDPAISPDGANIAYIGNDGNLWVVKINGSGATQLTSGSDKIIDAIRKSVTGAEREQFNAYDQSGVLLRYYHPYSYPSWSPDGKRIIFTSMAGTDSTGRPNEDIWIMNADGSGLQQLTTNGSVDRFPLMSPDKKYIYFYSNRGMKWAIWRIVAP